MLNTLYKTLLKDQSSFSYNSTPKKSSLLPYKGGGIAL